MSFRITGLPAEHFAHLFDLADEELAARGAVRRIADGRTPGYPCRVSLTDSQEGDELLLVNYEHHPVETPYRMRFAVYVRRGEETWSTGASSSPASSGCSPIRAPPTCTSILRPPAATPLRS